MSTRIFKTKRTRLLIEKSRWRTIKDWSKGHEPVFTIIGVFLSTVLAIIGIYFSVALDNNTDVAKLLTAQIQMSNTNQARQRTIDSTKLCSTFRDRIMHDIPGSREARTYSNEDRLRWLRNFEQNLRSEMTNPFLYSDTAISTSWNYMLFLTVHEQIQLSFDEYYTDKGLVPSEVERVRIWDEYLEKVYDYHMKMMDYFFETVKAK